MDNYGGSVEKARIAAQLLNAAHQAGIEITPELRARIADISATRTWHMAGPDPISYAEIEAYCRLHRWPLQPHHVDIIRALDKAWLEHGDSRSETTARSSQPLSPALFDAVFG